MEIVLFHPSININSGLKRLNQSAPTWTASQPQSRYLGSWVNLHMYMKVSMTSGLRMKYFSFCRVAMASTPPSKRKASGPSFRAAGEPGTSHYHQTTRDSQRSRGAEGVQTGIPRLSMLVDWTNCGRINNLLQALTDS